jgi:hypothetical protein
LIGLYFYHPVGFKKGREAGLTLEGEVVAFDFSLVKREIQVALYFEESP